jgi:very-short-patch-repair endonuclease
MTTSQTISSSCLLERHRFRRLQSIPTVTVLCGPVGLGIYLWRTSNAQRAVPVVFARLPEPARIVVAWAVTLATHADFIEEAINWLGRSTGRTVDEWHARLSAMTLHDLGRLWQAEALDVRGDPAASICHWLLERYLLREPLNPETLVDRLRAELFCSDEIGLDLMISLAYLVPTERLPAILLTPPKGGDLPQWLESCGRLLGSLVAAIPTLAAAIAAPASLVNTLLQLTPQSQWRALVREGTILVGGLDESALRQHLTKVGVDATRLEASLQRLATEGVSEELAASFADAARHLQQRETPEKEDRARSAAERFLWERLESLPETTGLFALNQPLAFRHGHIAAEADLLAADLKLVIELDGSYFHLHDPDAYRRDRRKDWQLQRHGYLVLRFLADDVVERLEEILNTILAAIEFRRQHSHSEQRLES